MLRENWMNCAISERRWTHGAHHGKGLPRKWCGIGRSGVSPASVWFHERRVHTSKQHRIL